MQLNTQFDVISYSKPEQKYCYQTSLLHIILHMLYNLINAMIIFIKAVSTSCSESVKFQ